MARPAQMEGLRRNLGEPAVAACFLCLTSRKACRAGAGDRPPCGICVAGCARLRIPQHSAGVALDSQVPSDRFLSRLALGSTAPWPLPPARFSRSETLLRKASMSAIARSSPSNSESLVDDNRCNLVMLRSVPAAGTSGKHCHGRGCATSMRQMPAKPQVITAATASY